jgi:uncharacterized protein (DUF924 family)
MDEEARAVLEFWFEEIEPKQWFTKDPTFDDAIRERFSGLLAALTEAPDRAFDWAGTPLGAVAAVVTLDQFPRNLFRDDPRAFTRDPLARDVARKAVALGHHMDPVLDLHKKVFLFLPFEHGESLADQDWSVALIGSLGDADYLDYAERHRDIIVRFGRFPHRNAILGREGTAEEAAFLRQPGSSF